MPWLTNWNYRKAVTISNTGSTLSDYQVLTTIDTATLVATGKMQSDCRDIRFTDDNGSTLLSYWIESGKNTVSTKIWIKIPSISTGTKTIYLYYGNSSATSISNGTNTFLAYSDGSDVSSWATYRGGTVANVNGELHFQLGPASGGNAANKTVNLPAPWIIEGKWREEATTAENFYFIAGNNNGVEWSSVYNTSIYKNTSSTNLTVYATGTTLYSPMTLSTYYIFREVMVGLGNYNHYLYDANRNLLGSKIGTSYGYGGEVNPVTRITFGSGSGGWYMNTYVAWVFARKYASPEPTFGVTGVEESPICSTTTKNIGDILTLNATPIQGVAPYTVEFRRANSENMVDIIDTANINSETYIISTGRLGGLSNPVYDVAEGFTTTRLYTIDITDINDATSKVPGEGSSLLFATKMLDSCSPSQSCVKYCKIFVTCSVPICDFTVT